MYDDLLLVSEYGEGKTLRLHGPVHDLGLISQFDDPGKAEIPEGLDSADHARKKIVFIDLFAIHIENRVIRLPAELPQKFSVIPEVDPKSLGEVKTHWR